MGVRRGAGIVIAAVLAILLVTAEAWIPLGTETVREQREAPWSSDGRQNLQGRSLLIGEPGPDWLARSIEDGRFALRLEFMTFWPVQFGPARIFAISNGADDANLVIGQDGSDLVIRVRRPGSEPNGEPELRVPAGLRAGSPQTLDVTIEGRWLTAVLDGDTVTHVQLGAWPGTTPVGSWDAGQRVVVGDEEAGGKGWVGGIVEATINAAGEDHRLIASGDLDAARGLVEYQRERTIHRPSDTSPLGAALRILFFVPLGVVLRVLTRRSSIALALGAAIVVVIAGGKVVAPGRHASVAEVVLGLIGSAIGVALAAAVSAMRRRSPEPADPPAASTASAAGSRQRPPPMDATP